MGRARGRAGRSEGCIDSGENRDTQIHTYIRTYIQLRTYLITVSTSRRCRRSRASGSFALGLGDLSARGALEEPVAAVLPGPSALV